MIDFNSDPYTAEDYISELTRQFGTNHQTDARTLNAVDNVWEQWKQQGVAKPSNYNDFETAVHTPLELFHQYFMDIVYVCENLKHVDPTKTCFHIFPWAQFNAAANTLETNEQVILFDASLMAFFNSTMITIMTCVYSHPSNHQASFYEAFVLQEFDKFITKKTKSNRKDKELFAKKFQQIIRVDYDLTHIGASCAVAFNCFILCHEIAHLVLEHTNTKRCLQFATHNGNQINLQINNIAWYQEFEADSYGYQLFLELIEKRELTKRVKLIESYQLMPLVFFELIDLVYTYAESRNIDFYQSNTHPNPLKRKKRLKKFIDGKQHELSNELYDAFMEFSYEVRRKL